MRSEHTTYTSLPSLQDPVVVFVVSDDLELARRVRALTVFIGGVRVVDIRSVGIALEVIQALYESPHGCPDLVLLDRGTVGARTARQFLAGSCPGIRVLGFAMETPAKRIETTIRRGVREILNAIA
jgi:hypothetical protein